MKYVLKHVLCLRIFRTALVHVLNKEILWSLILWENIFYRKNTFHAWPCEDGSMRAAVFHIFVYHLDRTTSKIGVISLDKGRLRFSWVILSENDPIGGVTS